ncbi:hypothetical protein SLEP1_g46248 [Rubroshorea leprosula]|uniref:Uncharacterized protein n=2 Tax=Rubroshorea leprosula TaxID=152421 RepID=A0AAV5LMI3_9ROSI|nr:hypothetical protein SLEP1_g46248 [Rubroshorea leprosula]
MEWDGFLSLVVHPIMTKMEKMFESFVLNGYGSAKECCSKMLIVGPIAGVEVPLLFWGNDEILLESSDGGILVYDRKTRKRKKILLGCEKKLLWL